MSGSKPLTSREKALVAMKKPPPGGYFRWDRKDEDERPLTRDEMREGLAQARRRGRPPGSKKESTTIRFDTDVLDAFRAAGPGWQSRMNDALKDWLKTHKPARG
jgi:uncharacterized protein (DUF4415 family)